MDEPNAPILARTLARSGAVVGMVSNGLILVLACLIPFTVGVSGVLMPFGVLGWIYALIAGWIGRKRLQVGDPARRTADISFFLGLVGVAILAFTLVVMVFTILTGVVLSQVAPELFRPHRHH